MILNAIRFRPLGADAWHAYKLSPGAGRFRNYQALVAEPEVLRQFVVALDYGLTGKEPATSFEVQIQLSDDGGHTWTLQRRPGFVRYLKDGVPVDGELALRSLAAALMDLDGLEAAVGADGQGETTLSLEKLEIRSRDGQLTATPYGAPASPAADVRDSTERQMAALAQDAASLLGMPALTSPRLLTSLTRRLEPLLAQYREVARQYHVTKKSSQGASRAPMLDDGGRETHGSAVAKLAHEVDLIRQIAEAASPLLAPAAATLKGLKDDLAKTDAALAEVSQALGVGSHDPRATHRDFRKIIEALSRLEAHAKLIRASQGARKYCAQNIEPIHKKYLELAESSLAADRQITSELESCLASLTLRLVVRPGAAEESERGGAGSLGGPMLKTWFDRFKSRQADEARDGQEEGAHTQDAQADLETARMAIEYALGRLTSLGASLQAARSRHESVLGKLDEAHEELVSGHARLRDHWIGVARAAGLPEELDLNGLLKIVAGHGKLLALADQRQELATQLKRYTERLARIERLVSEWRKVTGSQKHGGLDSTPALLQEARDIIRYREPKEKRLRQLEERRSIDGAKDALLDHLKERARTLLTAWQAVCRELSVDALEISNAHLDQLFQRAHLVRALALVHAAADQAAPLRLFDGRTETHAATLYAWPETATSQELRLELLRQLETANGGELRVLLLADDDLGTMLSSLGVGMASAIKQAPIARGASAPSPTRPAGGQPLGAQATAQGAASGTPRTTDRRQIEAANAAMLTDKALRTLQLLKGKPGGR